MSRDIINGTEVAVFREYLRYRSATDLALQKSGQRTDDGWMAGQRTVKTEHPRSRVGGSQDSVLTKVRIVMYPCTDRTYYPYTPVELFVYLSTRMQD